MWQSCMWRGQGSNPLPPWRPTRYMLYRTLCAVPQPQIELIFALRTTVSNHTPFWDKGAEWIPTETTSTTTCTRSNLPPLLYALLYILCATVYSGMNPKFHPASLYCDPLPVFFSMINRFRATGYFETSAPIDPNYTLVTISQSTPYTCYMSQSHLQSVSTATPLWLIGHSLIPFR